ncbi:MAG: class I SAM-dependent methyltransferase [Anaerolineae bacterium]|nr:class I SAM-dependent methyltransferase [Anaerolineae bacterium]
MSVNWLDVTPLSFNTLLLLERVQIGWLPGWPPEKEMAIALHANPVVRWYLIHKNPDIRDWVRRICDENSPSQDPTATRIAEEAVMRSLNDLLTYAVDPDIYAQQEFLTYADDELLEITDFKHKVVLDIGAGTGRLTFVAAKAGAKAIFAVEPVENLRRYILKEAEKLGLSNVYAVDGIITCIPFYDGFADVVMGGHVFGDFMEEEYVECVRVTKPGGMVIYHPGSTLRQVEAHEFLTRKGFDSKEFLEPPELIVRKYWKTIEK